MEKIHRLQLMFKGVNYDEIWQSSFNVNSHVFS